MRSYDPTEEYDRKDAERLGAEPWMLDLLALNPSYPHWGPHEDYMADRGEGWRSAILCASWSDMKVSLDDMNEVVHFYFSIDRASRKCPACEGECYSEDALWVAQSFYEHSSPFRRGRYPAPAVLARLGEPFAAFCAEMRRHGSWIRRLTEDDVGALVEAGRLVEHTHTWEPGKGWTPKEPRVLPSAARINAADGLIHDAINRCILIEHRCKRFGIELYCETCKGNGSLFTAPAPHVALTFWLLHPRKGASRGVEVARLEREEVPKALAFLREAAERNAARFAKVVAAASVP